MTVGQKLWNLSRSHQVFCVTHLPATGGLRRRALSGAETGQRQSHLDARRTAGRRVSACSNSRRCSAKSAKGLCSSAHELMQVSRQMIKGK
ncbi:MAG: hypothetical protein MZV64_17150 [Ignavibacteriales bacterium]|nr:hypothetical protein [Ignavibacteriales bacterium]